MLLQNLETNAVDLFKLIIGSSLWIWSSMSFGKLSEFSVRFLTSAGFISESFLAYLDGANITGSTLQLILDGWRYISNDFVNSLYKFSANCFDSGCFVPHNSWITSIACIMRSAAGNYELNACSCLSWLFKDDKLLSFISRSSRRCSLMNLALFCCFTDFIEWRGRDFDIWWKGPYVWDAILDAGSKSIRGELAFWGSSIVFY